MEVPYTLAVPTAVCIRSNCFNDTRYEMDSLTHIAVGACIGDLFLGKKIGKKAMLYGAIAASLPDIDFISSFWLDTADDLMAHRGFTHSFLFGLLFILALAFVF